MFSCTVLLSPSSMRRENILDQPVVKAASSDSASKLTAELKATQINNFQAVNSKALLLAMLEPMQALNLSHCQLGDDEMQTLSEVLRDNRILTSLDLSHNNISREGARMLELGLMGNCSLTSLNLRANPVSNQSWVRGTQAELQENKLNANVLKAINSRLAYNQTLQKLDTGSGQLAPV